MTEVLRWGDAGPHVVLVHGAGLGAGSWFRVGPALAKLGFRVTAPHLLGYGAEPAPEDFRIDQDVAWVAELCHAETHLVGHSYGAYVALQVARRKELASLTLYEPVVFSLLGDDVSEAHRRLADDPAFGDPETGGDEAWLRRFIEYWQGPGAWDALPEKARQRQLHYGPRAFANVLGLHRDPPSLDEVRQVLTPTVLMHGAQTPVDAINLCALLAKTIPNAREVEVPGAGHMGPLTHIDALLSVISAQVA